MFLLFSLYKKGFIIVFIIVKFWRNNNVFEGIGKENILSNEVMM